MAGSGNQSLVMIRFDPAVVDKDCFGRSGKQFTKPEDWISYSHALKDSPKQCGGKERP